MSKYDKNEGYTPASDAVKMTAILVTVDTIITPFLLDDIYIDEPSAKTGGKAVVLARFSFDLFVHPEAKDYGVIAAVNETV